MASPSPRSDGSGAPNTIVPDDPEAVRYDAYPEVVSTPSNGKEGYAMSPSAHQNGVAQSYPVLPEKKICGLRRPTFFLLVLLILVIIAAAVGGGVGGSMAVSNAYERGLADASASATEPGAPTGTATESSPSSTESRVPRPPTEGILELDCPSLTDTTHRISGGKSTSIFRATCGVNHGASGGSKDITRLPAYSFEDCMTACAAFNDQDSVENTTCVLVHFNAKLFLIGAEGGNCWLKSKLGSMQVVGGEGGVDHLVEGELVR